VCGFICVGGRLADLEEEFRASLATLGPRGPDGVRFERLKLAETPIRLGHVQFHVMDPERSVFQPLRSASGRSILAFNGEIYNYRELAEALRPGAGWRPRSDTEVLVEGLERSGIDFLRSTNGIFAFVYVRLDRPELIAARDRLGVRPLYLARRSDGFALASTVRSLVASGLVPFELSERGLDSFLDFGSVYEPDTIVRGIEAVEPGTWVRWSPEGGWRKAPWWSLPDAEGTRPLASAGEELADLLTDSVRLQTRSRFPIGVFLSGGTDSSSLTLTLAKGVGQRPVTLSLDFRGEDRSFSESTYQRQIAALAQSEHHEVVVDRHQAEASLDGFFEAMDQPTIDGFNVFVVARAASELGVRTCFSGIGGDEVFAGYSHFRTLERYLSLIRGLSPVASPLRRAIGWPCRALGHWRPFEPLLTKSAVLLESVRDLTTYYVLRRSLFLPGQVESLRGASAGSHEPALSYRPRPTADPVTTWSALELGNYLRNTMLRDADVFGMTHPVEIRVPLLDHRIVELAFHIRGEDKVGGPAHKPLLQAATRGSLPRYTWDRRKAGFTLPWRIWLRQGLVSDPQLRGLLDPAEVGRIATNFRLFPDNQRNWSRRWALTVLERYLASLQRAVVRRSAHVDPPMARVGGLDG